jgi:hypothetical protein
VTVKGLQQTEPQPADTLGHEEVVTFGHWPGILHPLEDIFFDMAFDFWMAFDFKYPEPFDTVFRLATEAHRASVDHSSTGDVHRHVDTKVIPVPGNIFQPVL